MSSKSSEPPQAPAAAVASPCRRQCCLDDRDICIGCGRTLAEILEWGQADEPRRQLICQSARERLQGRP
ncbi:MAG TPA: DUF1289 domain-containing protein [Pseudomonas sp.]|uniref:DUF1289 domain-containing protein n=1 Tax=Pseudomonas sp. TaxID=306 RepID=UPI002BA6A793|nr:DUF1289 domain-containing protein [Pseudomonas sp.]HSX90467.1 DUF1289 domain-containing protein [Pseudomonas sp.]